MTDITPDKLNQAREWAENLRNAEHPRLIALAAAEVIRSLPDSWIDADELRKWMDNFIQEGRTGTPHEWLADAFTSLQNTFLTPAPRTLADMDEDEREACQWMQVDTPEGEGVLLRRHDNAVMVAYLNGATVFWALSEVTPLPDLPRLEWPASEPSSIDTSATINDGSFHDSPTIEAHRPEGVPDGYWLITHPHEVDPVPAEKVGGQWWIVGRGGMLPADEIAEITLVSRLLPEQAPIRPSELVTVEDYQNAPVGTTVAEWHGLPYTLDAYGEWFGIHMARDHRAMSGVPRQVLRWGWGEQA